jgi:hypothetical protein
MTALDAEKNKPKLVTIIVNGRQKEVPKEELSFNEVVALAYDPVPTGENVDITLTYRRGHGNKPEGQLKPGDSVKVKDGMIFDVTATDRS